MEQILKRKQNYFTPSIASCSFFAKQCFIIQNSSKHPLPLSKKAEKSISSITFNYNDITTIIPSLDPNKAHGHDMRSIRMLKICGKPICKPLPAGIYLFKVNNRNTRTRCEICSKLTINTPERRQWRRSGVFIVNFEHISHFVLVFLLLTLSR